MHRQVRRYEDSILLVIFFLRCSAHCVVRLEVAERRKCKSMKRVFVLFPLLFHYVMLTQYATIPHSDPKELWFR